MEFCVQSPRRLYSGEAGQSSSPGFSFPRLSEHLALLFVGMFLCFWAHPEREKGLGEQQEAHSEIIWLWWEPQRKSGFT